MQLDQSATAKVPFEAVVQEHGATVLRVCRAVLGVHDADDAWSDTFLSALQAYPALPGEANVQAWLVTIAHRKCIDHVRAGSRRAVPVDSPPERPSGLGIPGAGNAELLDAVSHLPPKQRQAVAYHYLAGLAYKDIAILLGGTPEAARRAGADGVKALRLALAERSVLAHSSKGEIR
ncbi:RNA polymerase sigma factor [Paenarthrobacter nitroguajacolicus]|uniref:RNA polymerase sigma factor n=1 Tax=Paenarthrobacter nitroguajacolicus TaxID=211146 RepID=A0A558H6Q3_PAENT|nr:RNA polymerase sigma factor [Paenarthrobacter nitroguajacolicus]TVU64798.1 RNA polymerase sigma factor [Paenarthrobacter nitroguajacolicus]